MYSMHNAAYSDRGCQSVSQSVTLLRCAKTDVRIEMLFGLKAFGDPSTRHIALGGERRRNEEKLRQL